jgi:hypothetical protein
VKAQDGSKASCICGKSSFGCRHHTDKISKGAYRSSEGYYVAMSDPARGLQGHGKLAFYYAKEKYEQLNQKEVSKMEALLAAQQNDFSKGDEEAKNWAKKCAFVLGVPLKFLG